MTITSRGAVLWQSGPYAIEEIEWADPGAGEVHVKVAAAGLCHSDEHVQSGAIPAHYPLLAGHEGAGTVVSVGPAVTRVTPGDHVAFSFVPSCGTCRMCSTGHQNLCDQGAHAMFGAEPRAFAGGKPLQQITQIGSFSTEVVVHETSLVKIKDHAPLNRAALLSCGVATGWGSVIYSGQASAGDTVVVVGCGGLGAAAIQAALAIGARYVIGVDPVEFKREQAVRFGATHTAASMEEAKPLIDDLTWGRMADVAVLTVSVMTGDLLQPALSLVGKGGRVVPTAVAPSDQRQVSVDLLELGLWEKQIRGTCFGSANPQFDIPRLLDRYLDGQLMLDEMVTRTYSLDEINQGYEDLLAGTIIRGMLIFE